MQEDDVASQPDGVVFDGARFRVRLRTIVQPIGGVNRYEIVETPAAAAIVPILEREDGERMVVLVEQERPAIARRTLEIPAGLLDAREMPEQTAARELEEETRYTAARLRHLTDLFTSPGISNEVLHLYLATDLSRVGAGEPGPADPTEILGVRVLPLREAVMLAARGEIRDAKTVVGLLQANTLLSQGSAQNSQTSRPGGDTAMPFDPTSIPQSITGAATGAGEGAAAKPDPGALTLESILTQEFGYANVTAYQAMEDRARIFGLYLTLVGILAAALGGVSQLGTAFDRQFLLPIAASLLLLSGALGRVFFTKLIRVRQAWRSSALAMGVIKEYYIKRLAPSVPDIDEAFFWRLKGLPKGEKRGTLTYMVCYTTAFISSLSAAVGVLLGGVFITNRGWIQGSIPGVAPSALDLALYAAFGVAAILVLLITQWRYTRAYNAALSEKTEAQVIESAAEQLGG